MGATFSHDYLEGYFETADSSVGTWFIDYSPTLGKLYSDLVIQTDSVPTTALVQGQVGSAGQAQGPVKIVHPQAVATTDFPPNAVLVCPVTTPDYVPLMQKACAIVTDQGGILSHAAIVARELKKACIVGAGNATSILQDGQQIRVDATTGTVTAV